MKRVIYGALNVSALCFFALSLWFFWSGCTLQTIREPHLYIRINGVGGLFK